MNYKPEFPVIIICGHFGSGKTNVAVALAEYFKASGRDVTLADLDIVNPYFRAADSVLELTSLGIRCINPQFANTNVDVPSLGPEVYSVFIDAKKKPESISILDLGGDNGAAALGQYNEFLNETGYEMLFIANKYRPLTETPEDCAADMREIEYYSRLKCTGIINNSNIGNETTVDYIKNSFDYMDRLCEITGLECVLTTAVRNTDTEKLVCEFPERNVFLIRNSTRKLF